MPLSMQNGFLYLSQFVSFVVIVTVPVLFFVEICIYLMVFHFIRRMDGRGIYPRGAARWNPDTPPPPPPLPPSRPPKVLEPVLVQFQILGESGGAEGADFFFLAPRGGICFF